MPKQPWIVVFDAILPCKSAVDGAQQVASSLRYDTSDEEREIVSGVYEINATVRLDLTASGGKLTLTAGRLLRFVAASISIATNAQTTTTS